jgi:hypothetical protein
MAWSSTIKNAQPLTRNFVCHEHPFSPAARF